MYSKKEIKSGYRAVLYLSEVIVPNSGGELYNIDGEYVAQRTPTIAKVINKYVLLPLYLTRKIWVKPVIAISLAMVVVLLLKDCADSRNALLEEDVYEASTEPAYDYISGPDVTVTYYHPVVEQCDEDPLVTADGSQIDLDRTDQNWVAVSRDLLGQYPYGTEIFLIDDNTGEEIGPFIVKDTMNKRFQNAVDVLLMPGEKMNPGKFAARIITKRELNYYEIQARNEGFDE